jgi:hypothetical protein
MSRGEVNFRNVGQLIGLTYRASCRRRSGVLALFVHQYAAVITVLLLVCPEKLIGTVRINLTTTPRISNLKEWIRLRDRGRMLTITFYNCRRIV